VARVRVAGKAHRLHERSRFDVRTRAVALRRSDLNCLQAVNIRRMNFQAVLFDCDGVLVDSEPITNAVLRDMLEERGWAMSPERTLSLLRGQSRQRSQG